MWVKELERKEGKVEKSAPPVGLEPSSSLKLVASSVAS